jgi:hypothetical protein
MPIGLKEKAVLNALGPAMSMIDNWTKDIKPENEVALFVEQNLGIIFKSENQKVNPTMELLTKLGIAEANDNPEYALLKFLNFYEAFRIWYTQYQEIVKELKIKTKQSSILEAVSIAVYHYLKCQKEESNEK